MKAGPGHIGGWLLWLLAAALPALTTRNPAYLFLLLLALVVVQASLPQSATQTAGWGFFLRIGMFLWLLTIPINALTVHYGETVLLTIPRQLPLIGSIIGGPITLEAIVYGFISGLGLLTILLVFVTFNRAVDPYRLMRTVPPAFQQTGVMASIALSFVPQAAMALREIREAQAIRGHRWRGLRDLVPLMLPLLTTGMERALQLAESMEARGFGTSSTRHPRLRRSGQALLLAGPLALLAGLLLRGFQGGSPLSNGILLGGGGAILAALILHSRSVSRSYYRSQRWGANDAVMALCSGLSALGYVLVLALQPDRLSFYPYPALHWPDFWPVLGLLILGLTAPAWLTPRSRP